MSLGIVFRASQHLAEVDKDLGKIIVCNGTPVDDEENWKSRLIQMRRANKERETILNNFISKGSMNEQLDIRYREMWWDICKDYFNNGYLKCKSILFVKI